ncbi:unnamed protein product, partial [Brassica napus]
MAEPNRLKLLGFGNDFATGVGGGSGKEATQCPSVTRSSHLVLIDDMWWTDDPKYPNSIRTRYGPRKLRIFHGYFKYRSKPTRIREERLEPEPKISMYLLSPNVYDSKDPD